MNGDAILLYLGLGAFLLLDIVVVLVILSRSDRDRRTRIQTAEERQAAEEPQREPARRRPWVARLSPDEPALDEAAVRELRREARDPVSPYVKAVCFATLAFLSLFGILFALSYAGIAAPLLVVGFFVLLFGLETFAFRRLAYFAIGAILFLGFILLIPPEIILNLVPIMAVAGFLAAVGLILWQRRSEKSAAYWKAWGRRHRARAEKGEKTARILGKPDPAFSGRERPSSIQRSRQVRAKRMMYPVP